MAIPEETIVRLAENHYFWVTERAQAHQDNTFRIYLTLAALILSCCAFTIRERHLFSPNFLCMFLTGASIFMSCFIIIFCVYHMRGERASAFPNLREYIDNFNACQGDAAKATHLMNLTRDYMECGVVGQKEMRHRARALRTTSIILGGSFTCLLFAWAFALYPIVVQALGEILKGK